MDAVDVAERRDAEARHVGALPQAIAVDEPRARRILRRGVRAAHVVARRPRAPRTPRRTQRRLVAQLATGSWNRPVFLSRSPLIVVLNGSSIW